jgi:hypothetical protein
MTPEEEAVIREARVLCAGHTPWHYENADRLVALECALENLTNSEKRSQVEQAKR